MRLRTQTEGSPSWDGDLGSGDHSREQRGLRQVRLLVALATLLLTLLTALLLVLLWLLRGSLALRSLILALRSLVLALRPSRLLLMLGCFLLWLLRLTLGSRLLRGSLALLSLVLALRPSRLLLTLGRPLLWLLPLRLGCRAALLRRRLCVGGFLSVSASLLRWLSGWDRRSAEWVTGGDTHIMTPLPRTVYGPPSWEDASLEDWLEK